ncbi:MAG: SOS response-associated peptidase [Actinobacteria bacterium]|nr:SOS response-associated peptidase [Actinomycetota bacterium]MCB9388108.1 SOS response-associated peptidase [Acidimicrobiia bacterium]
MCGRFVSAASLDQILGFFDVERLAFDPDDYEPHYNVAPTMDVPTIAETPDRRVLGLMTWRYAPAHIASSGVSASRLTINARSETAAQSGYFKSSLAKRRCLIPANGFYEWRRSGGSKIPYLFRPCDGGLFAFGAIWAPLAHDQIDEPRSGFAILTTRPNELVAPIHDRMPVILPADLWDIWLDPEVDDAAFVQGLCVPLPAAFMTSVMVGRRVNDVRNDDAACLEPAPPDNGTDAETGQPSLANPALANPSLW